MNVWPVGGEGGSFLPVSCAPQAHPVCSVCVRRQRQGAEAFVLGMQLLNLHYSYYGAAIASGLGAACRLRFAEAATGEMREIVLAAAQRTWRDRGAQRAAEIEQLMQTYAQTLMRLRCEESSQLHVLCVASVEHYNVVKSK